MLKALNDTSLEKQFESVVKQTEQIQKKTKLRNADFHFYKYVVQQNKYSFNEKTRKNFFPELKKADFHLDCYYFINKLKTHCDILGYKNFLPVDTEIKLFPDFFDYLEQQNLIKVPGIYAYFLVAKMLSFPNQETYFHKLKIFLFKNNDSFNKGELSILFTHLINYCIHLKMNIGNINFSTHLFDIYNEALEKEIIIERNKLDLYHYKNIITNALQINKFEWVENFIQTYTNNLPKEHRENALTFNLAKVYFSQKKYNKVIEQLQSVAYKNHVYALGGKLILLKTYYELKEYIALDSLIDSFRIYIRRNKIISRDVKQQYLNMLRFVKKLSNTIRGDEKSLNKISVQIDKCKALAGKKWILEKVEELG